MRRVVVTGMGVVSPVGNSVAEFYESISNGKNGISFITKFDTSESKYKIAAEVKNFSAEEILGKTTVRKTDPYVQFALAATAEAVRDSGLDCTEENDRLCVYYGSGIGGFNTFCKEHAALLNGGSRKVSPQFIPKMITNIAAGNIAIEYKATGACVSVSTACATGTTAIGEAYRALACGFYDVAICGGSEAAIEPLAIAGFANCQALSSSEDPDAASLPFDLRRGGFVMGEGAGTLVIEELEHALVRGAKIYAEICGYGSTCDAHHVTAPAPGGVQVAKAIKASLPEAVPDANKIYINTHGTGTPLNDKTETAAIKLAFGEDAYKLHISSTKSMTGHMLGAAGAAEAIAAILAIINSKIPPTINYKTPDPECDLDYTPNKALDTEVQLALSTSLGFGGHNACLAFLPYRA